jgi:peroxiredoxin
MSTPDWSTLPVPEDDGAANHLHGVRLPALTLPSTAGDAVDLGMLDGLAVLYIYPMTAEPGSAQPEGWDAIPGAKGCTPQSCAFRDHASDLAELGVRHLFGISAQSPAAQAEAKARLRLPFDLLSDADGALGRALDLPSFQAGGRQLLKRLTLVAEDGRIVAVFYPVFPPDQNAADVVGWLRSGPSLAGSSHGGADRAAP